MNGDVASPPEGGPGIVYSHGLCGVPRERHTGGAAAPRRLSIRDRQVPTEGKRDPPLPRGVRFFLKASPTSPRPHKPPAMVSSKVTRPPTTLTAPSTILSGSASRIVWIWMFVSEVRSRYTTLKWKNRSIFGDTSLQYSLLELIWLAWAQPHFAHL